MLAHQSCLKCRAGFYVFREDDFGWYMGCTGCGRVSNLEENKPERWPSALAVAYPGSATRAP